MRHAAFGVGLNVLVVLAAGVAAYSANATNAGPSGCRGGPAAVGRETATLTPPPLYSVVVPAAAHAPGLDDTHWRTDLDIYMPAGSDFDTSLYLGFWPTDGDTGTVIRRQIEVSAGTAVALRDLVASLFQTAGTGSISIEVAQLGGTSWPAIVTRTYNQATLGTYGQYLAGVSFDDSLQHGESALLVGLGRSSGLRTNIGFASAVPHPSSATIELWAADGSLLSTRDLAVPAVGLVQVTDIFAAQGHPEVDVGYAVVRNTSPSVGFVTYASLVDGSTGDPTTVTGADIATAGEPLWVAAVAHDTGVGSSVWRTALDLVNPGAIDLVATVELLTAAGMAANPPPVGVAVPAGQAVRLDDAVAELFGVTGAGALRLAPDTGVLAAFSRTFNVTPDGTFGQGVPAVTEDRGIAAGALGALVQLRRNQAFRTNLGVVNLIPSPVTIVAVFRTPSGSELGRLELALGPYGFRQVNDAIPGSSEVDGGVALVSSTTPGALFLAYASVVDNQTGDPTFIPVVRVATPPDT